MDKKLKHLDFIQGVINRLSTNSFLLKGWSVVLVAALFALSARNSNIAFSLLAYIPAIIFWGLDGYFLWQERLYRNLYDKVRVKDDENIDFSMNTKDVINTTKGWVNAFLSKTLLVFHGTLIATIFIVVLSIYKNLIYTGQ